MEKWYKGVYRRNLVDMHIADWDDEFLSKFSVDEYYDNLVKAHIQSPMIYLQSHTGLCNYITKSGKTHEYFKKHPTAIKELIDKCKAGGMKVVGYYSLIYNNRALIDHPEWGMIDDKGENSFSFGRYGLCCPNDNDYRQFVVTQMKEIAKEFPNLDGIFYDMPFWPTVCRCKSCQERWEREVGGKMPEKMDWNDERWRLFNKKRQEWMTDFAAFVSKNSHEILPFATCELNLATIVAWDWLAGATEGLNEACEFAGGDLYGDLYNHSFTCKYYYGITKNQPFEYMTCRCDDRLSEHTVTKTEKKLEAEVMLTAAHHGASFSIDAINPDGSMDSRVYDKIGKVFEIEMPYEKYMDKGEMYGETAVFFDSTTQFSADGKAYNKDCAIRAVRTLIENHIPVRVIANGNREDLSKYQMIIAPALQDFYNSYLKKFIDYVKNGGTLYLSGKSDSGLIKEFFGGEIVGETFGDSPFAFTGGNKVRAYIAPVDEEYKAIFGEFNEKYPLPVPYNLPIMKNHNGKVVAKVVLPYTDPDDYGKFSAIHSNPPAHITDIPAIIETKYGEGKVIWCAANIENDGRNAFKDIFIGIVNANIKKKIQVNSSKFVESVIFSDGENYYVNLFDLNFAKDLVERYFTLKIDGNYELYDLIKGDKIQKSGDTYFGKFKKYIWLFLKKTEK